MPKKLLWLILPIAAVGAPPIVYHAKDWLAQTKHRVAPLLSLGAGGEIAGSGVGVEGGRAPSDSLGVVSPNMAVQSMSSPLPGIASDPSARIDLAEVLRFEISPDWVMRRWPWVSAGLSKLHLQGYRVPLVTGTFPDDVAGSLTYYFNARQQCEQITLEGTTGDPTGLLKVLIARHGFARRLTNDPGLFRYEVPTLRGPAKSYLDIRLIQPNDPHRRYQIELVLVRPE